LALFYRCFAIILISYAAGFALTEWLRQHHDTPLHDAAQSVPSSMKESFRTWWPEFFFLQRSLWLYLGQGLYIAFFLVVHLMKLHSLSLVWGVTTEAMEYEEVARKRNTTMESSKTRIQRLALVGFGGTMGGILGRYAWFEFCKGECCTKLCLTRANFVHLFLVPVPWHLPWLAF
jgi:hypothetical protein